MLNCPSFCSHLITIGIAFLGPCCGNSLLEVVTSSMALNFSEADAVRAPGINTLFKDSPHVTIGGVAPHMWRSGARITESSVDDFLCSHLNSHIVNAHIDGGLMERCANGTSNLGTTRGPSMPNKGPT